MDATCFNVIEWPVWEKSLRRRIFLPQERGNAARALVAPAKVCIVRLAEFEANCSEGQQTARLGHWGFSIRSIYFPINHNGNGMHWKSIL